MSENIPIRREEFFLGVAQLAAKRSHCKRAQVGAVIVLDGRIISTGYNGPPSGHPHCEIRPMDFENWEPDLARHYIQRHPHMCRGKDCDISIHAEANAIVFAAKNGISLKGAKMFCTMSPCNNCAKLIINSGITTVFYEEEYRDNRPILFLRGSGINIAQFDEHFDPGLMRRPESNPTPVDQEEFREFMEGVEKQYGSLL